MSLTKREQNLGSLITFLAVVLFLLFLVLIGFGFKSEELLLLVAGSLFIVAIGVTIFLLRKYRKENNPLAIDYLNVGVQRHILGLFMIFYGIPKLFGAFFDYQLFALDTKLVDVSEFELAWYFYGKNRWQELVSGIMEFIPGILLFHRRTYYIGAILLLPVTAQVFILNLFFKIGGVTFPAAVILLACNAYILFSEKEKIIQFIRSLNFSSKIHFTGTARMFVKAGKWIFIALAVTVVGMRTKSVFFKSDSQRKYEQLVGMYTLEKMKKNNVDYTPVAESRYYKDLYIEKQSRWNILRKFDNTTDAFILDINKESGPAGDSVKLFINKGGIGDSPDIKDYETVIKGIYTLDKNTLIIKGVQQGDTLELRYSKQALRAKEWFW